MVNKNKKLPIRLNRSELSVPGSRPDFFEKAAVSDSDIIFFDLEDSVAIEQKKQARKNVIQAIQDIDWGKKSLSVRVNSINSGYFEGDLKSLMETNITRLDLLMLPKVDSEKDVLKLEKIVKNYEKKYKRSNKIGFELIIESARGLINVNKIAKASKRTESLHFGAADFAASIGAKTLNIGGVNEFFGTLSSGKNKKRSFFLNDIWQVALFNIKLAASANNLRAIDCPYGDFNDYEGFESISRSSYTLGFNGKMVIHPNQIKLANKIFSPTKKEYLQAKEMLNVIEESSLKGKGAVAFKGKLLDNVTIKQANNVVQLYQQIIKK